MSDRVYGREESDVQDEGDTERMGRNEMRGMISKEDRDTPQIEGLLNSMVGATDRLEASLEDLQVKIRPILGPSRPELTVKDPGEDGREMSDIAEAIDIQVTRLKSLRDNVEHVASRVEC